MNSTALIPRPPTSPRLWVLEVDGPRRKYVQRGEGAYYLATDNHPVCDPISSNDGYEPDERLKDWDSPCWEIYQFNDGRVEIHACRPTDEEIKEGDLHGALGSVIKISWACRPIMRNALRLARRLCLAHPEYGIHVTARDLVGIVVIESNIPVYLQAS